MATVHPGLRTQQRGQERNIFRRDDHGQGAQSADPGRPGREESPARARLSKAWTTVKNWFSRCFEAVVSCGFCRNKVSPEEEGREAEVSEDRGTANADAHGVADDSSETDGTEMKAPDHLRQGVAERRVLEPITMLGEVDVRDPKSVREAAKGLDLGWLAEALKVKGTLVLGGTLDETRDDDADRDAAALVLRLAGAGAPPMDQVDVVGQISPNDTQTLNVLLDLARAGVNMSKVSLSGEVDGPQLVQLRKLPQQDLNLQNIRVRGHEVRLDGDFTPIDLMVLANAGLNLERLKIGGTVDIAETSAVIMGRNLQTLLDSDVLVDTNLEMRGTINVAINRTASYCLSRLAKMHVNVQYVQAIGTVSVVEPAHLSRLKMVADAGVNVGQVTLTGVVDREDPRLLETLDYLQTKGVSLNTT
jgi:hypothetical protein